MYNSSWPFILMAATTLAVLYATTLYSATEEKKLLVKKKEALQQAIELALLHKNKLQEELDSLKDPSYLEIVLQDKLGLIPEKSIRLCL